MKTPSTLPAILYLFFFLLCSNGIWANRVIRGSLSCDGIHIPDMASVRINAYDADGNQDDLMGRVYLTNSKTFEIKYENKKWDPFPMDFITWWRPDIYIAVEIMEEEEWITVYQSEVYEDWKTNYDLEVHIYIDFKEALIQSTRFSPVAHGWPFHALYVEKQSGGVLSTPLSGALCFGALDLFYAHRPREFVDSDTLLNYLVNRKLEAEKLGSVLRQYGEWQSLPDLRPWTKRESLAYETKQELSKMRTKIDAGKPAVLVLIPIPDDDRPLGNIRQVVVYKYEWDQTRQRTRLWVYDPELFQQDEAVITIIHGAPDGSIKMIYHQDKNWKFRGFFINPYDREEKLKSFAFVPGRQDWML